jgi:hypothetical protein
VQGDATVSATRGAAGLPRRAGAALLVLARENRLFTAALEIGAVIRLFAVVGYPGALWFAGDSYVYLGAALRPQPNLSKSTGYSFFLRALLPFHSLTLVVVLQHLMGLTDGVLIYALLRRNKVSKVWATIASLPMLLDGYIIEDEHLIMTEALYTFCVVVAMTMLLWKPRLTWWKAFIIGLLAGYAVIVHTEGTAVIALFPLFALLRGRAWKTLAGWGLTIVMCIGILLPYGGYAAWFHQRNGQYATSMAEGFFLWGRMSSFADCARIKPTGELAVVCPAQAIKAVRALRHQQHRRAGVAGGQQPADQVRGKGGRGSAARLRQDGRQGRPAVVRLPADQLPRRGHGLLLRLPRPLRDGGLQHAAAE